MHVTSAELHDDHSVERAVRVGDLLGTAWTPVAVHDPVPLVLLSHGGGLRRMYPRLVARARQCTSRGMAAATIELPGSGDRRTSASLDAARADLRHAIASGGRPTEEVIDRLILPLVEQSAPEWQSLIDAMSEHLGVAGPVGFSGGVTALGVRLAAADPRIAAAGLFAGSYLPRSTLDEARQVTIPVHVLLQWDDHGNDRQRALDLFDALGSSQKTLNANTGGHTGVPQHAADDANAFLARHLLNGTPVT